MPKSLTIGSKAIWTDPHGRYDGPQPARIIQWNSPTVALVQLQKTGACFAVNTAELEAA